MSRLKTSCLRSSVENPEGLAAIARKVAGGYHDEALGNPHVARAKVGGKSDKNKEGVARDGMLGNFARKVKLHLSQLIFDLAEPSKVSFVFCYVSGV